MQLCRSWTIARPRVLVRRATALNRTPMMSRRSLLSSSVRSVRSVRVQSSSADEVEEVEEVEQESEETTTSSDDAEAPVMTMADSLVERANEAANGSSTVDETFVAELTAELEQLKFRAESAEKSAVAFEDTLKSTKDQFVRLTADFENFRKRSQAEQEELKTKVRGDALLELLPLIDNFELAKQQLKIETEGEERISQAYDGLYKQMVDLFRGLGLEATPGVGTEFDPEVHEAIMREHSDEFDEGVVSEEFRKGFMFKERLLRPAMVKVAYKEG